MADEITTTQQAQLPVSEHGILDKTLGEIIQHNPQAQDIVMKAMNINPQQFQKMLQATGNNQLMHMSIRDMFQNGIMQQAASGQMPIQPQQGQTVQVTPEQMQQLMNAMPNGQISPKQLQQNTGQNVVQGQVTQSTPAVPQKQTFFQKLKGLFQ